MGDFFFGGGIKKKEVDERILQLLNLGRSIVCHS
jgi:hypothetical protein